MNAAPTATSATPAGKPPVRLGDRLLQMGLVSSDQIQIGLLEQKKTGKQLGDALIALSFVTEEAMREALGFESWGASSGPYVPRNTLFER